MRVKFWGVRGSIPTPGPETATVGGNTSCVELTCGDRRIVLDAGTGLRNLGDHWLREGKAVEATILLSHTHWDHIQGLPFFVPLYVPGTKLAIHGSTHGRMTVARTLEHQMTAPVFPVRHAEVAASVTTHEVRPGAEFRLGDVVVRAAKLNHPGGVLAYRVEHGGRSIVYATDTEHYACVDPTLVALARGADVLVYDAQYTQEEYAGMTGRSRVGWGHSTNVAAAEIARAAGVSELVLFHHDPTRTDRDVAVLEKATQDLFPATVAAREGLAFELAGVRRAA